MDLDFLQAFGDCVKKIESIGTEYSEAKANSWHSQELVSSIKASIMKNLPHLPVSKAEIEARTHEDYLKHLEETKEAIKKELRLKCQYEAQKARFEGYRSLSSLEKATRHLSE